MPECVQEKARGCPTCISKCILGIRIVPLGTKAHPKVFFLGGGCLRDTKDMMPIALHNSRMLLAARSATKRRSEKKYLKSHILVVEVVCNGDDFGGLRVWTRQAKFQMIARTEKIRLKYSISFTLCEKV